MKKIAFILASAAAIVGAAPAMAQTAYNTDPTAPYTNGTGGNYIPSNFAVLTFDGGDQIALRNHISTLGAPASDSAGNYYFNLGATGLSYEFSIDGQASSAAGTPLVNTSALFTLTDQATGQVVTFNPFDIPDNTLHRHQPGGVVDLIQNSEKFVFPLVGFGPLGFDPNRNDTYTTTFSINDAAGTNHSLTINAIVGSGAAVPEAATWAMMILGMGMVGFAMRRGKTTTRVSYAA